MASFAYSAINASGLELKGEIHAPDMTAAREALRVRGMLALDLKQQAATSDGMAAAVKKVKPKSLQIFSRQFATMIEAGLNVVTALVILEDQTEDKKLAAVITEVRADVEGGLLLSEAIARHPRIFSRLYISMVEAGEAAGILDVVLDRVALQIEKETQDQAARQGRDDVSADGARVRDARPDRHAAVPRPDLRRDLRAARRRPADADEGGREGVRTSSGTTGTSSSRASASSIWGFLRCKKTERAGASGTASRMKAPVGIGKVVLKVGMARFSRTLSTLVGSGVDIIRALEITGTTSGNSSSRTPSTSSREQVHQGVPIAIPLGEIAIFPPMVVAHGAGRRGDG